MMNKLVRYLRGYISLKVEGGYLENFLNSLSKNGIVFWKIEPQDGTYIILRILYRDGKIVEKLAKKCQCEVYIINEHGATKIKKQIKKRLALCISLVCVMVLLMISSLFVWEIEVIGNENVTTGEILRALEDKGVYIGSFWLNYKNELIRNEMLLEISELSWLTVNVNFSKATVIVRERLETPTIIEDNKQADIIASKDGIIFKMDVLEGRSMVTRGTYVLSGDLLISGYIDSEIEGTAVYHVYSQGTVTAYTYYEISAVSQDISYVKEYTGEENTNFAIIIGKNRINLNNNASNEMLKCDKIIEEYPLSIEGAFSMPISLVKETYKEYNLVISEKDLSEIVASLEETLYANLKQKLGDDGEILSSSTVVTNANGKVTVCLRAECLENIAKTVD